MKLLDSLNRSLTKLRAWGQSLRDRVAATARELRPRLFVQAAALGVLFLVSAQPAAAAPFDGLAEAITQAMTKWSPALIGLGSVVLGSTIMMGSHETGKKLAAWFIGGVLLVLGAAPQALMGMLQPFAR
jgi:hypothetical protein